MIFYVDQKDTGAPLILKHCSNILFNLHSEIIHNIDENSPLYNYLDLETGMIDLPVNCRISVLYDGIIACTGSPVQCSKTYKRQNIFQGYDFVTVIERNEYGYVCNQARFQEVEKLEEGSSFFSSYSTKN